MPSTGGDAEPGSIDVDAMAKLVDLFSGIGHPIMVIFNYGTTFKCGYDDVETAGKMLVSILKGMTCMSAQSMMQMTPIHLLYTKDSGSMLMEHCWLLTCQFLKWLTRIVSPI